VRQIDRLILKEIVGPWVFGVALFSALIMAATYLNKIADLVVNGAPGSLILQTTVLLFPAVLVKTFTMAVLLGSLLAFGRLSSDSEIVALRAGGASIMRIVRPVVAFSAAIALLTFFFNEAIVPAAASRAKSLLVELAKKSDTRAGDPIAIPVARRGELQAYLVARALNPGAGTMSGVTMVLYGDPAKTAKAPVAADGEKRPTHYLYAKTMEFRSASSWEIRGQSELVSADGNTIMKFDNAWPTGVPTVTKSPIEMLLESNNDPDILSMRQVRTQIEKAKLDGDVPKERIANWEYWYWNKLSVPLAAVIFGTLGAVLGIRNHRTGTAAGFALAIAIIFGYITLANFMAVWAQGGVLPSWAASFAPVAIGLVASGIIMWRRNA